MANLLIDDLNKGKVVLPNGLGSYEPPDEIRNAILNNPDEFRAGSTGPDFYPDIQVGQTVVHPKNSGDWLRLMFEEFSLISPNDPEREKALSFLMGFMMHYAADLYGHDYVNGWAGGWFPSIDEALTEPEKMKIIARHMLVESYMDTKVPENSNMSIAVPVKFLKNCFMNSEALQRYKSEGKIGLHYTEQIRKYAFEKSQNSTVNMLDITNYFKAWEGDLNRGINEWFNTWHKITVDMVSNDRTLSDAKDKLKKWVENYLCYMTPAPDYVADVIKFIATFDLFKPVKEVIEKEIKEILNSFIKVTTGIDVVNTIEEIKKMFKNPELYLNSGILYSERNISIQLDKEFGNFGQCFDTLNQSFIAFQKCLNMGKLCLIGPHNLNQLIKSATCRDNSTFKNMNCPGALESLNIRIKTKGRSWRNWYTGTDDNVYFGVILKNNQNLELLLDKPGYNDFEAGDNDTYSFTLPRRVLIGDVKLLRLRKDYINISDDWTPESMTVTDQTGRVLFNGYLNVTLKGRTPLDISVDLVGLVHNNLLQMDHSVISFLYSLDGAGKNDNRNPTAYKQWTDEKNVFYSDTVLREKIYFRLFENELITACV